MGLSSGPYMQPRRAMTPGYREMIYLTNMNTKNQKLTVSCVG